MIQKQCRPIPWLVLMGILVLLLFPAIAMASEGGGPSNLKNVLYLIGVISIAYLGAHVFAEALEQRLGIVTGVEYIIIGILVGPWSPILKMFNATLIDQEMLKQLSPFLVLGTGAIGLLTGLRFDFIGKNARPQIIKALIIAGTTFSAIAIPIYALAFWKVPESEFAYVIPLILCSASLALVADTAPIRTLIAFLDAKGEAGEYALAIARTSSSLAIIIFGSIFCMFHDQGVLSGMLPPSLENVDFIAPLEWLGIHLLIGTVLGGIFSLFLLRDFEDEKILTVAIGIVIFTSGLAFYLKLSPIFVNFILGVVLKTFSKQSDHVEQMLVSVERPLYITLFFFGGAIIAFDVGWWAYALIVVYLGLRWVGRGIGGILAFRFHPSGTPFPPMGAVLWAPGGLSIAMLLNIRDIFGNFPYAKEFYIALLGGIVVSEVVAYKYTRRWLIDSTDVALVDQKESQRTQNVQNEGGTQ